MKISSNFNKSAEHLGVERFWPDPGRNADQQTITASQHFRKQTILIPDSDKEADKNEEAPEVVEAEPAPPLEEAHTHLDETLPEPGAWLRRELRETEARSLSKGTSAMKKISLKENKDSHGSEARPHPESESSESGAATTSPGASSSTAASFSRLGSNITCLSVGSFVAEYGTSFGTSTGSSFHPTAQLARAPTRGFSATTAVACSGYTESTWSERPLVYLKQSKLVEDGTAIYFTYERWNPSC